MTTRVNVLALNGAMAGSITGVKDLLSVANVIARRMNEASEPLFSVQIVSPDGAVVTTSSRCQILPDGGLELVQPGDMLFCPAFMIPHPADLDRAFVDWQPVLPWLREIAPQLAQVATNCSGAYLLAEAGLLKDGMATTAWWLCEDFRQRYPDVALDGNALCVRSGHLITGAASSAYYDVVLAIVEQQAGKHFARLMAKYMMLDNQRRSQAPYAILTLFDSQDDLVSRAEQWIRAHIAQDFRIEALASAMAVSPRTLIRRFQATLGESPQSFTQKLRIEKSKILLETTSLPFTDIVNRCGYADESAFRRLFKRYCQLSPREYRRRFSSAA